jgi:hypothetical protein
MFLHDVSLHAATASELVTWCLWLQHVMPDVHCMLAKVVEMHGGGESSERLIIQTSVIHTTTSMGMVSSLLRETACTSWMCIASASSASS